MSTDDVLDILLGDSLVLGIIYQFTKRFVHWFVGMATDEYIDPLKAICRSVIDIVLCLMLNTDYIMDLLSPI